MGYRLFKIDKGAAYLAKPNVKVLEAIAEDPGIEFEDLMEELRPRVHIGPKHLRAILSDLFSRDYIITDKQISALADKDIDVKKIAGWRP